MTPEYYLTQPQEVAKYQALRAAKGLPAGETAWLEVVQALAGDDPEVFSAMWSFWNFAHAFDDLLDESGWNEEQIEAAMAQLHEAVVAALLGPYDAKKFMDLQFNARALAKLLRWNSARIYLLDRAMCGFFMELLNSDFIRRHAAEFRCLFVQAMTRCLDGDALAKSVDSARRLAAPVVRCGDVDALLHMVYLARGWAALRAAGNFREYDLPDGEAIPIQRKEVG